MRLWIGVASKEHVQLGVAGGFCQLCHGRSQPLKRMGVGDWIVYYSSKEKFGEDTPCQQFTAIGEVVGQNTYAREMAPEFTLHRRDIRFVSANNTDIRPLIAQLSFIKNKIRWGYSFRFGHFEISSGDFKLIAKEMLGFDPSVTGVKGSLPLIQTNRKRLTAAA